MKVQAFLDQAADAIADVHKAFPLGTPERDAWEAALAQAESDGDISVDEVQQLLDTLEVLQAQRLGAPLEQT